MRCVRPAFTSPACRAASRSSAAARCSSAGTTSCTAPSVAATCTEVGNTSFDDCEAFTWSFGCTAEPSARVASVARTSFMFMFEDVPDPVW